MVDRYNCPPMSDQQPEANGCMVYYVEYSELARRIETMERDRHSAESENKILRDRVKALTAERDDYILKQKTWEGANDELRALLYSQRRREAVKAIPMRVYWAEANGGNLEWPKGMLVVTLGEHDDLQKASWKYGKHLASCRRNADMTSWCDCGWDKIRETLSPPAALPDVVRSQSDAKVNDA